MSLTVVKKLSLVILMILSQLIAYVTLESVTECEVLVDEPWPGDVFAPENSTVLINCTTTSDSPLWAIDLASDGSNSFLQFSNRANVLNTHGVYELPLINEPGMPTTLRLLINDTAKNNGTKIVCDGGNESFETTLYIYEQRESIWSVLDTSNNFINISWSSQTSVEISSDIESFLLMIRSNYTYNSTIPLNESFYPFTAPEDAPPCEVYNFSVTATYIGATYTGAGCSVPSPVLSTMLPSLPDIDKMERTIKFTLAKLSGQPILNVSFEPASYCEQYPIQNYTLEIKGPLPEESLDCVSGLAQSLSNVDSDIILSENAVYSFRVLVANSVGVAFTNYITFYTTDVQMVTANTEGGNTATIQCNFTTGSNARGCMVRMVLSNTSLYGEESQILTRNLTTNLAISTILLNYAQSCYHGVEAFDVESDDTVGSLAVPGMLFRNVGTGHSLSEPCMTLPKSSSSWLEIVLLVLLTVTLVTIIAGIVLTPVFIKICIKRRRSSKHSHCEDQNVNCEPDLVLYEEITSFGESCVTTPNEEYGVSTDGIETTPNEVYGVSTDGIQTTPNEVYGVGTDGIETTPNEVYGVSTDGIQTTPNVVYGVSTDSIETTPNKVYGVSTDVIETTPNEVYGVSTDGIESRDHAQ